MHQTSWIQTCFKIALSGVLLTVPLKAGDVYKVAGGTLADSYPVVNSLRDFYNGIDTTNTGIPGTDSYTGVIHYYYDSSNRLIQASRGNGNINAGFSTPWAVYYGYDGDKLRYEHAWSGDSPGVPNEPAKAYYKLTYYEYGDDYAYTTDDLGNRIPPGKQLVFKREVDERWHNTLNYAYYHYAGDGRLSSVYHYNANQGSMLMGWDEYTYDNDGTVLYIDRWGQDNQGNWGRYLGYWGFAYYHGQGGNPDPYDLPMDGYLAQKTWYDPNWNPVYSRNYHYCGLPGLEFLLLYEGQIGTGKTDPLLNPPANNNNMGTHINTYRGSVYYTVTSYGGEFGARTSGPVGAHNTELIYMAPGSTTPIKTNYNPVDPLNFFRVSDTELLKLVEP